VLAMFHNNKEGLLRPIKTIDETFVHHFTHSESKEQPKQWTNREGSKEGEDKVSSADNIVAFDFGMVYENFH
jgi:hypothetical protein